MSGEKDRASPPGSSGGSASAERRSSTKGRGSSEGLGSTGDQNPAERSSAVHPYLSENSGSKEPRPDIGYRHRRERRTARRAARRRRRVARLSLVAGPVVVVILVIVALLVFLGGPDSTSGAETTTTTAAATVVDGGGSSILLIEQGEEVPAVVLLPEEASSSALAMPGNTLLRTDSGFKTPAELHASDDEEALGLALARDLDVDIGPIAWLQWSDLREVLDETGRDDSLPVELETTGEDALLVAEAMVATIGVNGSGDETAIGDKMEIAGDAQGFRANVERLSASVTDAGLVVKALPGKVVEGAGFEYFEPDMGQARALLRGEGPSAEITMEVQNGSGVVGMAQLVGGMLEPLGYEMLPFRNAEDFPDVTTTRIIVAPDAGSEAERVRAVLGVGKIEQDDSLELGRVIVIVGKDFVPPVSTGT